MTTATATPTTLDVEGDEPVIRFPLRSSEELDLTPELVAQFDALGESNVERELSSKRLKWLHGQFFVSKVCLGFDWVLGVLPDGKETRVDGQHSCHVLAKAIEAQIPLPQVTVRLRKYDVVDEEDLIFLFRQFNPRKSNRSMADISGAYQKQYAEIRRNNVKDTEKLAKGCGWWLKHVAREKDVPGGDDIGLLFERGKVREFIGWIAPEINSTNPQLQKAKIGSIGALFGLYDKDKDDAQVFLDGLLADDPDPDSIFARCNQYLLGEMEAAPKKPDGGKSEYEVMALTWNLFRKGEKKAPGPRLNVKPRKIPTKLE